MNRFRLSTTTRQPRLPNPPGCRYLGVLLLAADLWLAATPAVLSASAADRHEPTRTSGAERLLAQTKPGGNDLAGQLQGLLRLAKAFEEKGDNRQAAQLWVLIVGVLEKVMGSDHPYTAASINNLARLYQAQGRYGEAEALFKRALTINEKAQGPEHSDTAININNLAGLFLAQGRYGEAEPFFKRALTILEKAKGPEHPITATSLNNLAELYQLQGRYEEAELLFKRALTIHEKALGRAHPDTATSLNNLAGLYQRQGRYGQVEPLYKRALAICEKVMGTEHPDTAASLNNLAALYQAQGRYGEAELLFKRALTIHEKALGPDHPITATSLNNLADLYQAQGRHRDVEPLYQRALTIREKALGSDHPDTAASLNNLAALYQAQDRYREAETLYKRSLAIAEKALGPDHPDTASNLNNLADLYQAQGRYGQAKPLFLRSLAIRGKGLGPEHPATANGLTKLAFLELEQSQPQAARPLVTRLTRSQADWLRRELPLQPRELRLAQLQAQADAVATAFALLDQDPSSAALALETRLNRQGLLAEIEQRQRLLLNSSPETRTLGERLAGLDRRLASVTLAAPQRTELRQERQQLEAELNRRLPALRMEPVTAAQVAGALRQLAPQGLLVEFQRFRPRQRGRSGGGEWGAPSYVALLLRPDGEITSMPLGEAAPIDQAIGQALSASQAGRPEATELWGRVSALVVAPLKPRLQGVHELFLSPDGGLHRIPFAALPMPEGGQGLLSDVFRLRLLTTGRDLVQLLQPAQAGGMAVLIANPDYESRRSDPGTRPVITRPTAAAKPERQLRSGALGPGRRWSPLPASATEAQALAPLLHVSHPITGAGATAPLVLQQKAPRILHIATHGFFERDQPPAPAAMVQLKGQPKDLGSGARREDPLLRSGLVMAGANHPDADPGDDGYLTAAEATGMDLHGTELVTLSACQTALGDLQNGEGVYGLQRALTVAGSRSTLLSLWSVDDGGTKAFMEAFYERIGQGMGRAEALAATQAAFRQHPNPLFRSVFIWGAFQLTGDWRALRR